MSIPLQRVILITSRWTKDNVKMVEGQEVIVVVVDGIVFHLVPLVALRTHAVSSLDTNRCP